MVRYAPNRHDTGSTTARSVDEVALIRDTINHYGPVFIAPLSIRIRRAGVQKKQFRPQIVPWSTLCRAAWVRKICPYHARLAATPPAQFHREPREARHDHTPWAAHADGAGWIGRV